MSRNVVLCRIFNGAVLVVAGAVTQDGNIPSGEAFVRQLLLGQRYFMKEFGCHCTEVSLCRTNTDS